MKIKERLKNRGFLIKMASTFLAASLIPLFFFGYIFVRHAYDDVIAQNEKYYAEVAANMNKSFHEQLNSMRMCAAKIDYDRKIIRSTVERHPYNSITAIDELQSYANMVTSASEVSLHFTGADYVLSSLGKYGYDFFLSKYFKRDPELSRRFETLLSEGQTEKMTIISEFGSNNYQSAALLVLIPIRDYATVIFSITNNSFDRQFLGSLSRDNYHLMMFGSDSSVLYDNSGAAYELLEAENFPQFLQNGPDPSFSFRSGGVDYRAYKSRDNDSGITFVVSVTEDEVTQSRSAFYVYLGRVLLWTGVIFLALFAAVVYVNYNPVRRISDLVRKSGAAPVPGEPDGSRDELNSIKFALMQFQRENDTMSRTISEQNDVMADFVLMNLVDGRKLPEQELSDAVSALGSPPYCMAAAALGGMDHNERGRLEREISSRLGVNIYIARLLHESYTFFLCSGVSTQTVERRHFALALQSCLAQCADCGDCTVGLGVSVESLGSIRTSYLGALSALESDRGSGVVLYEEMITSFGGVDEKYSEAVLKFLQYVRQGDRSGALQQLDSIGGYILSHSSFIIEKYLCFGLVGDYLKLLSKLGFSPDGEEVNSLLAFNNTSELFNRLAASVNRVCEQISDSKEQRKQNFARDIVAFVDENFTDPDMSLIKLSDKFGLSIYALSRIFKEHTGIGYKEYVTGKRIEFSKQLLLNTTDSISDIAARSGFIDSSSFSRMFKNNCGVSPNKFRE